MDHNTNHDTAPKTQPADTDSQPPEFNIAQRVLLQNYADGDFAYMLDEFKTCSAFQAELERCGDGLLRYLLGELDTVEGCEDLNTADERIDATIDQLNRLRVCMTEEMEQLSAAPNRATPGAPS